MAHIKFVDETLRDGMQSLWGMRMQAGMALPIVPVLDQTGFSRIEFGGSSYFEVMVRYCRENPWEGLKAVKEAMPDTIMRSGMRSNAMATFKTSPPVILDTWMRLLNGHGVRSFWLYDLLYNIDHMHRLAGIAKEYGSEVAASIMFGESPVHTDEYFAEKTRLLAASPDVDTILLYDTAGVLSRERMTTLIPAIKRNANGKPIEFHANNLLGMSARNYLDAVDMGISVIHTASRPMANGPSVPSTEIMANNLELLGHTHDLDKSRFSTVAEHMEAVGKAAGFLVNQHAEYDVFSIKHQIPGGMTGTLKAQLAQHGMSDRLDDVLREVAVVREELGYPGMATPFSQLVGIQAVLNTIGDERYSTVPDEIIEYALGYYGEPAAPINENILDRILSSKRAKEVMDNPPENPSIEELRQRYSAKSDEELLLKFIIPEGDLEKMHAAGPLRRDYPLISSPDLAQVDRLLKTINLPAFALRTEDFSITLK